MNRKIGEKFTIGAKTYEVRECGRWSSCKGCAFQKNGHPGRCVNGECSIMEQTGECNGLVRDDGKYVYFAEVTQ